MRMNIPNQLHQAHSLQNSEAIVRYIGSHPKAMDALMTCFVADDWRMNQRAAWPVEMISRKHPDWLLPYFPALLERLKNPKHDALVRNVLRAWQHMDVPEVYQGEVADYCFQYLSDSRVAVAIRVFAMTILKNICGHWPEMAGELRLVIEEHLPVASPGFKSRGSKVLRLEPL